MYVVRDPRRRNQRLYTAPEVVARYSRKHRAKGRLGPFVEVEDAGADKSRLDLTAREAIPAEHSATTVPVHLQVGATTVEVAKVVRAAQDEDLERLAEIDERLEEKRSELAAIRKERRELVEAAWSRAEKLPTLSLFIEQAEVLNR